MANTFRKKWGAFCVAIIFIFAGFIFFQSPVKVSAQTIINPNNNSPITISDSYIGAKIISTNSATGAFTVQSTLDGVATLTYYNKDGNVTGFGRPTEVGESFADLLVGNGGLTSTDATGECIFNSTTGTLWNCLVQAEYYFLWGLSYVVNVVVSLFDVVFDITVVKISDAVSKINAIKAGWTAVRDLANICFIFILLYLSIATILQLDEHGVKHSLSRLIIAAMLINFSLFFTKVIIDIPNILSIEIYNKIISGTDGVGTTFFKILKPEKINNSTVISGLVTVGSSPTLGSTASQSDAAKYAATGSSFTTFIMMIILYFFICIVFLAATIIFIKRFVMLIFYMIFSPLAFAAMAMPVGNLGSTAKSKFWDGLIKEAFYAPVFMLCIYIASVTGQSSYITAPTTNTSFIGSMAYIIFNFAVVIVMLVASLFIAEEMGVKGAGGAMGMFNKMKGWGMDAVKWTGSNTIGRGTTAVLRGTVGRLSYDALEGKSHATHGLVKWMTEARTGNKGAFKRVIATGMTNVLHAGANVKAGKAGESFMEAKEEKKKGMKAYEYEIKDDPKRIAEFYHEMSRKGAKDLNTRVAVEQEWEEKPAKEQAEIIARLKYEEDEARGAAQRAQARGDAAEATEQTNRADGLKESVEHLYTNRLSAKEKDEVDRASEGAMEFHRERFDDIRTSKVEHEKYEQAVQKHGATSQEAMRAQVTLNQAIQNVEPALQTFYNSLNVNQKVGLRPEQFSMPFLHRDGLELEQVQRKSNMTSKQREEIAESIGRQLTDFLQRANQNGLASISDEEQADMRSVVQYMDRNGKTWFAGQNNMALNAQAMRVLGAQAQPQGGGGAQRVPQRPIHRAPNRQPNPPANP